MVLTRTKDGTLDFIKEKLGYHQWHPSRVDAAVNLSFFVGVPVVLGFIISLICAKDIKGWYKTLKKPRYTSPDFLFGPIWTVLYVMMGISAWLVWTQGGWYQHRFALGAYIVQALFNFAWNPLFFFVKKITWALVDIIALLGSLATTIVAFNYVDPLAAMLLVPYFLWVSYATYLNFGFFELNPQASQHTVSASTLKRKVEDRVRSIKSDITTAAKSD